jgi:hypothetical protein
MCCLAVLGRTPAGVLQEYSSRRTTSRTPFRICNYKMALCVYLKSPKTNFEAGEWSSMNSMSLATIPTLHFISTVYITTTRPTP